MTQQSTEDRLAALEKEVVELKQKLTERLSFEELRADVKKLRTDQTELRLFFEAHEQYVTDRLNTFEEHITTRLDVLEDTYDTRLNAVENQLTKLAEGQQELQSGQLALQSGKLALQSGQLALQSGQDQILAILTGKAKPND